MDLRRMFPRAALAAVVALPGLAALPAGAAAAPDAAFIIVNPAGRGNQDQAGSFLAEFSAALAEAWPEAHGMPPSFTGHYHVTEADALASIRAKQPVFALTSPGFFEARREELGLGVLAVPVREGDAAPVYRLVARADDDATLARLRRGEMDGLRVGGQVAGEPDFARRSVLAGLRGEPTLVPVARTLDAVRRLRSKALDVALVHDADWQRLPALGRADGLVVARSSPEIPEGPVVAIGGPDAAAAQQRLALARAAAQALSRFPQTPRGRAVLERMTLSGFRPPRPGEYDAPARQASPAAGPESTPR